MRAHSCWGRVVSAGAGAAVPRAVFRVQATLINRAPASSSRPADASAAAAASPAAQQQPQLKQQPSPSPSPLPSPSSSQAQQPQPRPPLRDPSTQVVALVLGGGAGKDLWPLTHTRAEPAVPFAGLFRLVDVPVSNCLHSNIRHVYVLTQWNASSLNRHLSRAYAWVNGLTFTHGGDGFVEALSASQRPGSTREDAWFQGTADAIKRYLYLLDEAKHSGVEDVLVLAGDQLYRMDYGALIDYHRRKGAAVTIATTPADEDHAQHLGVLAVDPETLLVNEFYEKPPREVLSTMSVDTFELGMADDAQEGADKPFVASMGIYVIKRDVLVDLLTRRFPKAVDFSRDILALVKGQLPIFAYPFHGYWIDCGHLRDYYSANMALAADPALGARLGLFDREQPLFTESRVLPPSRVAGGATIADSLVGDAVRVGARAVVRGSVVGSCAYVGEDSYVADSIIFGADLFDTEAVRAAELAAGGVPLGVGAHSRLERVIVDSNARIGRNVSLTNRDGVREGSGGALPAGVVIREGLTVVMKAATVPDGTVV